MTALALVGIVFAMGVYGVTQIKSDFDPVWYMRNGTYQQRFYSAVGDYFPGSGEKVDIFVGESNHQVLGVSVSVLQVASSRLGQKK